MGQFDRNHALEQVVSRDSHSPALGCVNLNFVRQRLEATDGKIAVVVPFIDDDGIEAGGLLPRHIFQRIRKKAKGQFLIDQERITFTDTDLGDVIMERPDSDQPEFPSVDSLAPSEMDLRDRRVVRLNVDQLARVAAGLGTDMVDVYFPADPESRVPFFVFPAGSLSDTWGIISGRQSDTAPRTTAASDEPEIPGLDAHHEPLLLNPADDESGVVDAEFSEDETE